MGSMEFVLLSGATGAAIGSVISIPARRAVVGQPSHLVGPGVLAAVTAAMFAALAASGLEPAALISGGALAAAGVPLAAIDLAERRLPTVLIVPLYISLLTIVTIGAAFENDGTRLVQALAGMVGMLLFFLLIALVSGELGAGDVRLAGALGLALAWQGWPALVLGALLGLVYGAVAGLLVVLLLGRSSRSPIPLGPALIAGALTAILIQPTSL